MGLVTNVRNEGTIYGRRQTAFGDTLLLRAVRVAHDFPLHRHDYYGFALIDDGVEAYYARGSHHHVTSRDMVLLNAGDAHTGGPHGEDWSYRMLILEPETVAELTRDGPPGSGSPLFGEAVVQDEQARAKLIDVMAAFEQAPELLDERLVEFHADLVERHGGGRAPHPSPFDADALTAMRDMLIEEPAHRLSLTDLAAVSGLSRTYIVTAFRQRYGLPPAAFQIQHRLSNARRRLIEGHRAIADIAVENGFYDQSDFNRHFSRTFGISPSRMRRQVQGGPST